MAESASIPSVAKPVARLRSRKPATVSASALHSTSIAAGQAGAARVAPASAPRAAAGRD
jgi:hypothetical protein